MHLRELARCAVVAALVLAVPSVGRAQCPGDVPQFQGLLKELGLPATPGLEERGGLWSPRSPECLRRASVLLLSSEMFQRSDDCITAHTCLDLLKHQRPAMICSPLVARPTWELYQSEHLHPADHCYHMGPPRLMLTDQFGPCPPRPGLDLGWSHAFAVEDGAFFALAYRDVLLAVEAMSDPPGPSAEMALDFGAWPAGVLDRQLHPAMQAAPTAKSSELWEGPTAEKVLALGESYRLAGRLDAAFLSYTLVRERHGDAPCAREATEAMRQIIERLRERIRIQRYLCLASTTPRDPFLERLMQIAPSLLLFGLDGMAPWDGRTSPVCSACLPALDSCLSASSGATEARANWLKQPDNAQKRPQKDEHHNPAEEQKLGKGLPGGSTEKEEGKKMFEFWMGFYR